MAKTTDVTFEDVAASGPPCPPLPFPEPTFTDARRLLKPVHVPDSADDYDQSTSRRDSQTGPSLLLRTDSMAGNVLVPLDSDEPGHSKRAYWIQRKLNKTTYGSVRVGYVLRPRTEFSDDEDDGEDDDEEETSKRAKIEEPDRSVRWEVTPISTPDKSTPDNYEMVAIKMYDRSKIKALRGRRMEDPMVELFVSQMIATKNPDESHVLGTLDVLADERFIYQVLPYCGDGELIQYIERMGTLKEGAARHFFRQVLKGLCLFQQNGLCHRDLCLEQILLSNLDCFIVGKSKCLKVPYSSVDGSSKTMGISEGTVRRLILPQGQCGRPNYMAPEVLANKESFDGFAVDLWAAGIMLFYMLFGDPPFVWAGGDDPRFEMIAVKGELRAFVQKWVEEDTEERRSISDEAVDLLQKMLKADPKERLSLHQVMEHAWVVLENGELPTPLPHGPRNIGQGK